MEVAPRLFQGDRPCPARPGATYRVCSARFVIGFMLVFGGCRCADPIRPLGDSERPFPAEAADKPFVYMYSQPGNVGPGCPIQAGIVAAVWPDGKIVRAASVEAIGKAYVEGHLTDDQVRDLRRSIAATGILTIEKSCSLVPCGSSEELRVRWGSVVRTWAYWPGRPMIHCDDCPDRRILAIRKMLMALSLDESKPVEAGECWN